MACTCTEDKEVLPGGVIIGRNKVTCQECLDANVRAQKAQRKQELLAQLAEIERKIYYSQLDGETAWVESKMAVRAAIKSELAGL
jgi:hypothetical protein